VHRPGLDITDDAALRKNFVGYGGDIARDVELRGFGWAKNQFQCQFTVSNDLGRRLNSSTDAALATNFFGITACAMPRPGCTGVIAESDILVQSIGEFGAGVGCRHCGCQSAVERGVRLSSISYSNVAGRTGQVDRGEQGADDGAHQPDLEPNRVLRYRDRICRGRARFWRMSGTNSKPWSAHSMSSSHNDNIRPSQPPGKAG
jgi:hypothetical protein